MKIETNKLKVLIGIVASYVSTQIFSDLLALKIVNIPYVNFSVTAGILLYPFTFTIRDMAHKVLGKKHISYLIIFTILLNILMVSLLFLVVQMEPGAHWDLQNSYQAVFMPVWRITIASIVAELLSQLLDTYIFSKVYRKGKPSLWAVVISNLASSLLDSLLFVSIAFIGVLHNEIVLEIALVQAVIKILLSIAIAPTVKLIPIYVNKEEI